LPDSNGEPKHVRSNFINEALFSSVLQTIDRIQDCSEPIRHQLKVIAILTYRGGLRLSEVLKLQLKDLESSEEGWLFVRNNRYDDNKNTYSRRKIPLWPLLKMVNAKWLSPIPVIAWHNHILAMNCFFIMSKAFIPNGINH